MRATLKELDHGTMSCVKPITRSTFWEEKTTHKLKGLTAQQQREYVLNRYQNWQPDNQRDRKAPGLPPQDQLNLAKLALRGAEAKDEPALDLQASDLIDNIKINPDCRLEVYVPVKIENTVFVKFFWNLPWTAMGHMFAFRKIYGKWTIIATRLDAEVIF